jgi:hypothetical protein
VLIYSKLSPKIVEQINEELTRKVLLSNNFGRGKGGIGMELGWWTD